MAEHRGVSSLAGTGYERSLLTLPSHLEAGLDRPSGLAPAVGELFRQQESEWDFIRQHIAQLAFLHTNDLQVGGADITIQFNAERAKRGKGAGRKIEGCFLDIENLPEEQRGLEYAGLFVAPNPFPILEQHLTGILPRHADQSIDTLLQPAYQLAEGLGEEYAVFYNGPKAGASAPKHAHVQAVRHTQLPIETTLQRDEVKFNRQADRSTLHLPKSLGRTVLSIDSPNIMVAQHTARAVIERLPIDPSDQSKEPRINLLIRALGNGSVRTFIAPRTSPDAKLSHDGETVLKPASLEAIGGIMVVSSERDYEHLGQNPNEVSRIFDETMVSHQQTREHLHDLPVAA